MTSLPDDGSRLLPSFTVLAARADGRWQVQLLSADADTELPELERALGEPSSAGRPGPFVLVVDSRLHLVALRHGPGGRVRALLSDATSLEWVLAAEVVERYGIAVEGGDTIDSLDEERGLPGGDLDVFADAGLPADELARLLGAEDLWADEVVVAIAERLGFADELVAVAAA